MWEIITSIIYNLFRAHKEGWIDGYEINDWDIHRDDPSSPDPNYYDFENMININQNNYENHLP